MTKPLRWLAKEYSALIVISVLTALTLMVAGILFGVLHSSGLVEVISMGAVRAAEFGGPIAGFLATFFLLFRSYRSIITKSTSHVVGTVMTSDNHPAEGARVIVEGRDGDRITNSAGWFEIEVSGQSSYKLIASYEHKQASAIVARKFLDQPIHLQFQSDPQANRAVQQANAIPQQLRWQGPSPRALPEFLEDAVGGRLVLVVGMELSEIVGAKYAAYQKVVEQLADGDADPAMLDLFPSTDVSSPVHRALLGITWERLYTTNVDALLETANNDSIIPVVTDDEVENIPSDSNSIVLVKLCGDKLHPQNIRFSHSALTTEQLLRDSIIIFENLAYYLQKRPFLYIGYTIRNPFFEFLMDIVEYHFPRGQLPSKSHYFLGFDLDSATVDEIHTRYSNRLIPISLSTEGRDREMALHELIQAVTEYRRVSPRYRKRILPPDSLQRIRASSQLETDTLPLVRTQDAFAQSAVRDAIRPMIERSGKILREFDISHVSLIPQDSSDPFWHLLESSLCGVFVFGQHSSKLERLILSAMQNLEYQPVILVQDESCLGTSVNNLMHRCLDHHDIEYYIQDQITRVRAEKRFARCERYLEGGDYDSCIIHSWIAVEEIAESVLRGINKHKNIPTKSNAKTNVIRAIEEMRAAGHLKYITKEQLDKMRSLRNLVEHRGADVTYTDAEEILRFCKSLVRAMSFDIQQLVGELDTFTAPNE